MGIEVKRVGSPSAVAAAAFGGGQGKRRAQAQSRGAAALSAGDRQRTNIKAQQKEAANRRQQAIEDRDVRHNRAREADELQRKRQLQDEARRGKAAAAAAQQKRQQEFNRAEYDRRNELADARRERQQDFNKAEYEREQDVEDRDEKIYQNKLKNLSPDARQKYNEKRAAFQEAIATGDLTQDEIDQARGLLEKDLRDLVMNDLPPLNEEKTFDGRKAGDIIPDTGTGYIGIQQADGSIDYKENKAIPTAKDIKDWAADTPRQLDEDGNELPITEEDIDYHVDLQGWRKRKQVALSRGQKFDEPRPVRPPSTKKEAAKTWLDKVFDFGGKGDEPIPPEEAQPDNAQWMAGDELPDDPDDLLPPMAPPGPRMDHSDVEPRDRAPKLYGDHGDPDYVAPEDRDDLIENDSGVDRDSFFKDKDSWRKMTKEQRDAELHRVLAMPKYSHLTKKEALLMINRRMKTDVATNKAKGSK